MTYLRQQGFVALLAIGGHRRVAVGITRGADGGRVSGNATDRAFVSDMTRHHQSAILMSRFARSRSEHGEIRALAAGVISTQEGEISVMRAIGTDMDHVHHLGNGFTGHMGLSDGQMGLSVDMPMLESTMARDIVSNQSREIGQMMQWQRAWYGGA